MQPKILKVLGLSFQFFEYLSFEFEFEYLEKSLANFEKDNLKLKK